MYSLSIANLLFMLSDCGFCYRSSKNRAQLKATHGLSVRCWYLICRLNLTSKKMFRVAPSNTDTDTDRYYSGRKNANTHAIWTPNVRPKDVRYRILFIYRRAHTRTRTHPYQVGLQLGPTKFLFDISSPVSFLLLLLLYSHAVVLHSSILFYSAIRMYLCRMYTLSFDTRFSFWH